jgi:hypothetical protein
MPSSLAVTFNSKVFVRFESHPILESAFVDVEEASAGEICLANTTSRSEENLLARFPKRRPELPEAYRSIYVDHYKRNRAGASTASSLAIKMEAWMHRKVAADVSGARNNFTTLEIGAGSLNHLGYEPSSQPYEVVEPFEDLYEGSPYRTRVAAVYRDLDDIADRQFDRIISIATFEHLCDLPSVVARCGLLLAPCGNLRVAIPSEGTLLWTLGWKLTTGVEFRLRHGLSYG